MKIYILTTPLVGEEVSILFFAESRKCIVAYVCGYLLNTIDRGIYTKNQALSLEDNMNESNSNCLLLRSFLSTQFIKS